ncbi:cupin domain-containing protein [Streptomyces sp. NPDC017993]|uniref:cupin domain-containing protein n=1 Tax=Streptomyces sp. NPDC017993 TaxID=3365027 RepID=UPI003795FB6F
MSATDATQTTVAKSATDLGPQTPDDGARPGAGEGSTVTSGSSAAAPASFVVNIPGFADAELEPEPLAPEQIVRGEPVVTGKVLWESPDGRQIRGIWQITPGVVTDTEANELFVVVSGRATIEVEGGPVLNVGPGDACVLREGDRTQWTVHETLRKAYHISL